MYGLFGGSDVDFMGNPVNVESWIKSENFKK